MRLQLAGQMYLYATRNQHRFDRGFAEQALDDLAEAARLLPGYFRPHSTQAAVHERLGWSQLQTGSAGAARQAFLDAVHAYDRADALLPTTAAAVAGDVFEDTCERIHVRRTKCRLLSGEIAQAVIARRELQTLTEPSRVTSRTLYNTACLLAVALGLQDDAGGPASLWERRAWHLLGRSLLVGGEEGPWELVMTDIELQNLDPVLRSRFCQELQVRNPGLVALPDVEAHALVDEAMTALALVPPPPVLPSPALSAPPIV
jgi:hypothetical protein